MKIKLFLVTLISLIIVSCFHKQQKIFHIPYVFLDPNKPSINIKFPYKTYLITSGKIDERIYSCNYNILKTRNAVPYYIKISRCYFNKEFRKYNLNEIELFKMNSKYFQKNDKLKSLGIFLHGMQNSFELEAKIIYFINTEQILKVNIKRRYNNLNNQVGNEKDWIKNNKSLFESFKTFALYVYKDIKVNYSK